MCSSRDQLEAVAYSGGARMTLLIAWNSVKYNKMKKTITLALAVLVCMSVFGVTYAQDTEPPLGLPTIDDTTTATTTPVPVTVMATSTTTTTAVSTQEAIDDAEVGTEVVMLIVLSLGDSTGIFDVKKYFDVNRYNL